jgi:uncharacterized protein YfaS (alpha-2-macroglobulin family)
VPDQFKGGEGKMKREIFLAWIVILGMLLVSGCTGTSSTGGTIFGKVTQMGSEKPMPGAEVTVYSAEGVKLTTTSDASGDYSISNIPPGSYKVRAYLQGYHLNETMEEIKIVGKEKKKVDFQLVIVGGGT